MKEKLDSGITINEYNTLTKRIYLLLGVKEPVISFPRGRENNKITNIQIKEPINKKQTKKCKEYFKYGYRNV